MKYLISSVYYRVRDIFCIPNEDLKTKGYFVCDNLLSGDICDEIANEVRNRVNQGEYSWKDETESDFRIMNYEGSNHLLIEANKLIKEVFAEYIGSRNSFEFVKMANVVTPQPGNSGSGGGWHRDSLNRRQLKLMIYLSDVDESNGAFEYIESSHTLSHKFKFNGLKSKVRFTESSEAVNCDSVIFSARKGTGIIFDSSGLHRGRPCLSGERIALTYYTYQFKIPKHVLNI